MASLRNLIGILSFTVMVGCGGGGSSGGGSPGAVVLTAIPPPPAAVSTVAKAVDPSAVIDTATPAATQLSVDQLVAIAKASVASYIKTSVMFGVLNAPAEPWPFSSASRSDCTSGGNPAGYVSWTGADAALGVKGTATYTACDRGVGSGPIAGKIDMSYTRFIDNAPDPADTDYAVDMTNVALNATAYSGLGLSLTFTGAYDFSQRTGHTPTYVVDTGVGGVGLQRVVGQPIAIVTGLGASVTFDVTDVGYHPTPTLVRSNYDTAGRWVELKFDKWAVDASMVPSSTCTPTLPCKLTITAANGWRAEIVAEGAGRDQKMNFIFPSSPSVVVHF